MFWFTRAATSPPSCFGKGYENDDPRCIGCSFNAACRREIISNVVRSGVTMTGYYPQYSPAPAPVVQPPQQFYSPAPPQQVWYTQAPPPPPMQYVQTQPQQYRPPPWTPPQPPSTFRAPVQQVPMPQAQQVQTYAQPGMVNPWSPVHFQIPASLPYSHFGYYGYYPDQMWGAVAAVAPVWRPQQPGESFGARVTKNIGLVLLEHVFQQLMLATRQAFLPPRPPAPQPIPQPVSASQATVDVTPRS